MIKQKRWTYEECVVEASKYDTLGEFFNKSNAAYHCARRHGWLKDYIWLSDGRSLKVDKNADVTYKDCYDAAMRCKSLEEFKKTFGRFYRVSYKRGYTHTFKWLYKKRLCYDDIYSIARKYDKLSDFKNNDNTAYQWAKRHKVLCNFTWLTKLIRRWDRDACYREACKYVYLKDFRERSHCAYDVSIKHGWIKDYYWLQRYTNRRDLEKFDKETMVELIKSYPTRSDFIQCNSRLIKRYPEIMEWLDEIHPDQTKNWMRLAPMEKAPGLDDIDVVSVSELDAMES